ncbi:MAG: RNA polymerase sigma-70 factor [Odoribacter sp.]
MIEIKYSYDIEAIFKKYYGALCYYASRYVVEQEVAQDLVQDIFVKLLESKQHFETAEHLRNFLYLAVKNNCLNDLQKDTLKEKYGQYARENISTTDFPEEDVLTAEVFRNLKMAVDDLPLECRKIFYMSYFETLPNEKIAQQLNISINTVRAQKMRGKKILKDKLKKLFPLLFIFPQMFV